MFERVIFEQIQEIWNSEQVRCNHFKKDPPEFEAICAAVETAFLASLRREEGLPLEFSLAVITQQEISDINQTHPDAVTQVVMRFQHPLPLDVDSITKIAGAFDKNTTALAVEPAGSGCTTQYQIWGALFYGPSTNLFTEVPFVGAGFSTQRPDCLIITTASVGSLAIARHSHLLGRFESGKFIRSIPSPFASQAMGKYLIAAVQTNEGWDAQYSYWYLYIRALELLLAEASARGHGGTIILIPTAKIESSVSFFQSTYSFSGDLGIRFLLSQAIMSMPNPSSTFDMVKRLLARRLEALAQLASIDGALLISTEWEVLAFGAKLIAPRWAKKVLIGPDGFGSGGNTFERSKLGMRHRSAIDFIGACPAAIAFVMSEDGPIRGFAQRDSDTILCWPDCRLSMFV
nr:hypothetical protein [uncultured bacterium]